MTNLQFIHFILCSATSGALFGGGIIVFIVAGHGLGIFMSVLGLGFWIYSIKYRKALYEE